MPKGLLIVGLGNPGPKYDRTRHNVGFMAVDHLSLIEKISLSPHKKFQGDFGEGGQLRLLKPSTFMNLSGQSVGAVVNWYKLAPEDVMVIYDDLDLPLGKIRLRKSGSAGGHNGMRSIISHLHTQDFPRLRIGIGTSDRAQQETVDYVLGKFTPQESAILLSVLDLVGKCLQMVQKEGIDKAMSIFNSASVAPE
ncbi:MAG: aminoacyl-tRNA hydrolase [Cyanobacteria bacterium M5B4]|nr:MAG: aminoacyl-tRNA hydrolase [Cyanobacteria bacterium M5B4]